MLKFDANHFWWTLLLELLVLTPVLIAGFAIAAALLFGKGEPAQSGLLCGAITAAIVMAATVWLCSDFAWYWKLLLSLASVLLGMGSGVALLAFAMYRIVGAMKAG